MHKLTVDLSKPATFYLDLWITALESGIYNHASTYLHPTKHTYCAYGVLCDLFVRHGDFVWVDHADDLYYSSKYCIYKHSTRLPLTLATLAGITHEVDHKIVAYNDTTLIHNYKNVINYLKVHACLRRNHR